MRATQRRGKPPSHVTAHALRPGMYLLRWHPRRHEWRYCKVQEVRWLAAQRRYWVSYELPPCWHRADTRTTCYLLHDETIAITKGRRT